MLEFRFERIFGRDFYVVPQHLDVLLGRGELRFGLPDLVFVWTAVELE
ncbi:hypothetical protein [Bradyrhizobium sp. CCGUVB23]|nr:hypothetical protein [Bradyrhizobium sp. CCGUVB23]MCP3465627.1 hypothetical protein [Bradyrhizobium sp. CCGUVB23]